MLGTIWKFAHFVGLRYEGIKVNVCYFKRGVGAKSRPTQFQFQFSERVVKGRLIETENTFS